MTCIEHILFVLSPPLRILMPLTKLHIHKNISVWPPREVTTISALLGFFICILLWLICLVLITLGISMYLGYWLARVQYNMVKFKSDREMEEIKHFCWRSWGPWSLCLRMLDFLAAFVGKVTFKNLPQPIISHIKSFRTLRQLTIYIYLKVLYSWWWWCQPNMGKCSSFELENLHYITESWSPNTLWYYTNTQISCISPIL